MGSIWTPPKFWIQNTPEKTFIAIQEKFIIFCSQFLTKSMKLGGGKKPELAILWHVVCTWGPNGPHGTR